VRNLEAVAWKGDELFQGQIEDFHNFQGHGRDSLHFLPLDFITFRQVIDVILGMSWMKLHKAIMDIAKQLICLDSLIYGKATLHLPDDVRLKASMHHIVANSIEGISVVREFLDVFPDNLSGMPLERDNEFKIEL
jgi:hypothetical protein